MHQLRRHLTFLRPELTPHLRRFATSLLIACISGALLMLLATLHPALAQTVTLDLGDDAAGGGFTGRIVQLLLLVTVLSLAPSLLMMVTSFTRLIIVFSLLRSALGTQQSPPNMVMVSLALFLTFFIMQPVFDTAWKEGIQPLMNGEIDEPAAFDRTVAPFKTFMLAHVREGDLRLFMDLGNVKPPAPATTTASTPATTPGAAPAAPTAPNAPTANTAPVSTSNIDAANTPITVLIPAFMISELHRAFEIGFLLFLPFLIIDMVIASILMSMGMMMLPPTVISLPFKIIFFVLVDGWYLVCGSLVRSYTTGG